ncbi:MAG TPA: PQQ-dependent sugar dehydrogenase [Solirubrobacterales bacterium]|nr:PQQ-dependent sugar dehydrogenase [Solirubrobacterales bacterium]
MRRLALLVIAVVFTFGCGSAGAASLRPIGDFDQPVYVTSSPTNPERLLIVEREGRILESAPAGIRQLFDLTGLVSCCNVERGMLSIAPAPDFESSGRIYVTYTGTTEAGGAEGDVHLDSFRPSPSGGAPIREPILSVGHAQQANHNGGQLQFGPDGHLYMSLGDGGGSGDPFENGQDTEELLGKILRIDPHPGQAPAYSIPAGNPFVGTAGRDEIWAYGLRNPWRFSFDRATGDLAIADVGQSAREEIDIATSPAAGVVGGAGANYGWNCREGFIAYTNPAATCATASDFTEPVFDYPHTDPGGGAAFGCSIIGGYVVRDPSLGDLYGRYLYTDYCSEEIRSLVLPRNGGLASGDRSEGLTVEKPTSFGEDSCGRIYVASDEGPVYRFEGATPAVCPAPAAASTRSPMAAPRRLAKSKHGRLLLSAKRLRPGGLRFKVKVRLAPCRGRGGLPVQLSRNSKSFASQRLNRHCRSRFWLTIARPTPIRAFVRLGGEGERLGSHQLKLVPPKQP